MFIRILKLITFVLSVLMIFPYAVIIVPILGLYVAVRYILTGISDLDIIYKPMYFLIDLPYKIFE